MLEFRRCTAGCRCSNSPEGKIKTRYPRKDAKGQRGGGREGLGGRGVAGGRGSRARARSCVCTYQRKREKQRKRRRDSHAYLGTYRARRSSSHPSAFPRRFSLFISFDAFRSERYSTDLVCLESRTANEASIEIPAAPIPSFSFPCLRLATRIWTRAFTFARYSQAAREERARAALLVFDFPTRDRPATAAMLDRAKS